MKFEPFQRLAQQIFDAIPAELRQGVEYLEVSPRTLAHPGLPDVYTLGECATGELDLGMEEAAAQRSGVHLYHGSFREVARLEPEFDWEEELRETIFHEIRHHREASAGDDALEVLDWAEDENFRRRAGKRFSAHFYRAGLRVGPGAWEVDGDLFVERPLTPAELEVDAPVQVRIDGAPLRVPIPHPLGEVHYLYLQGRWDEERDVAVVLWKRRGFWGRLLALLNGRRPRVEESVLEFGSGLDSGAGRR
jgi:hypothetical protein